ncbi:hypothetical protein CsSME_00040782 [Camellia sinensis var. sinensis]
METIRCLFKQMVNDGVEPDIFSLNSMIKGKAYNSLVNSLALDGEVDEAVNLLWEMMKNRRSADLVTYRTVLDEICRKQRVGDAIRLLKELQEKELVDNHTYRMLLHKLKGQPQELK